MSLQREDSKKTDVEEERLLSDTLQVLVGSPILPPPVESGSSLIKTLPRWWKVASLWFYSEEKWRARAFVVAALALSLVRISLLVKISYNQRNLETALAEKDRGYRFSAAGFLKAVWGFAGIILIAAPLFAATDFVGDRLKLEWRSWLTQNILSAYYAHRSFYKLHGCGETLDNPDQRICDDVPAFTEGSTNLMFGITRKIFGVLAFSGILWSVAPNLVLFLFLYTAIGTWLTTSFFGKRLMQLTFTVLKKEGDLRFNLVRTRENSESIAFYGGEVREQQAADERLFALVNYAKRKIAWMGGLSLWTNFYSYVTMLIPPLMTAPRYFAGEVEFGVITQVAFAFRHIEGALNYLVDNLDRFSGLAAESERLEALLTVLNDRQEEPLRILHKRESQGDLFLESLTVRTPNGTRLICQGLDLELKRGQSLLIVGASGCGKSSLLRAICGLWTSGTGTVRSPWTEEMFFLPQKPYMPSGTLRQQILYPSGLQQSALLRSDSEAEVTDTELQEVLARVNLSGLAERVGGFDAEANWSHLLSLGEQQRIAFARLLLHKPWLAVLDEATGALDIQTESHLYKTLQQQHQSYVSVGHRMELCNFHSLVLQHIDGWDWRVSSMQDYLKQRPRS